MVSSRDLYILKVSLRVSCGVLVFTILVYELVTNEQQIGSRLKICGQFMDIIMG